MAIASKGINRLRGWRNPRPRFGTNAGFGGQNRSIPRPGSPEYQAAWAAEQDRVYGPGSSTPKPPAGPAVPAPTGNTASGPLGLPLDSLYQSTISGIDANKIGSEAAVTEAEDAAGLDYGIQFQRDPATGQLSNFKLDPTNPFSKASLLQKAFDQSTRGNMNSYASRGQLYSGALQNAQNATGEARLQGENDLLTGFGGLARQFFDRRYGIKTGAEQAKLDAESDRLGRAAGSDPAPAPGTAPGSPGAPQKYWYDGQWHDEPLPFTPIISNNPKPPWHNRPTKKRNGQRFYQRKRDGKWIPY